MFSNNINDFFSIENNNNNDTMQKNILKTITI
jgi:hypothetical protein